MFTGEKILEFSDGFHSARETQKNGECLRLNFGDVMLTPRIGHILDDFSLQPWKQNFLMTTNRNRHSKSDKERIQKATTSKTVFNSLTWGKI